MIAHEYDQPGFVIAGTYYPAPVKFQLGDPVLIADLTGMDFTDWAEAMDDEQARRNPVVLLGFVGVAVWQKHQNWTRKQTVRYMESVETFEAVGGKADDGPDADASPLDEGAEAPATSLPISPETSNVSPEPPAEP